MRSLTVNLDFDDDIIQFIDNDIKNKNSSYNELFKAIIIDNYIDKLTEKNFEELFPKILQEIQEYISTLDVSSRFAICEASETYRKIPLYINEKKKINSLRARIGKAFLKKVNTDSSFSHIKRAQENNRLLFMSGNNSALYELISDPDISEYDIKEMLYPNN